MEKLKIKTDYYKINKNKDVQRIKNNDNIIFSMLLSWVNGGFDFEENRKILFLNQRR